MYFWSKNTFKYSALYSLKRAKEFFTIVFHYQKLQAFLFPLPILLGYTLILYMTKIENEIVRTLNPSFYYRYVDDIITKWKKNRRDKLFIKLNPKKSKLKFTCGIDPIKNKLVWYSVWYSTFSLIFDFSLSTKESSNLLDF